MYSHTPPVPPPKPGSHEASRIGTPAVPSPRPPPLPDSSLPEAAHSSETQAYIPQPQSIPDPGDTWLPKFLQDKSKQDLATILSTPALLSALTHASSTTHPSVAASTAALKAALDDNMALAEHVAGAAQGLAAQRAGTQAQLLAARSLERAWRDKQAAMDTALAPFAPASLYQRAAAGVAEQQAVCAALEESFLDGGGGRGGGGAAAHDESASSSAAGAAAGGREAGERDVADWVRRYREAKKLFYLRQERKERWDEGRVGGWR